MPSNEATLCVKHNLVFQQLEKLDEWLAKPEVHKDGAIAGSLDSCDRPLYTYPEIAGYYLSYLAYRLQSGDNPDGLADKAVRVITHQKRLWSNRVPPPTRHYSQYSAVNSDWRNEGLFIFDLAMLWRGVTDVATQTYAVCWDGRELRDYIDTFFSDFCLVPVRWFKHRPENAPDRWSTRPGPYQLKVLAALRRAAVHQQDQPILNKLNTVLPAVIEAFNQARFGDHNPHSISYALEGSLLLGTDFGIDFSLGKRWVSRLAQEFGADNTISVEYRRSDAIAQLLRLSCCDPFFDLEVSKGLYELLVTTMHTDGSLDFTLQPCIENSKNTWPVLFARQALDFYRRVLISGKAVQAREYSCIY